jgi:hypothetical protein
MPNRQKYLFIGLFFKILPRRNQVSLIKLYQKINTKFTNIGGLMFLSDSEIKIKNSKFSNITAQFGGGMKLLRN